MTEFSFKREIARKLVHCSSVIYPTIYLFTDKYTILCIILTLFCIVVIWDFARIQGFSLGILVRLNFLLREKEQQGKRLSGATYFLLSCCLVIMFFPKYVAILSILILVTCDTGASLVGKYFSRLKSTYLNKSLEGFVAFNVVGVIVIILYYYSISVVQNIVIPDRDYLFAFIALVIASVGELFSNQLKIDDNLLIPIIFASVFSLGQ